MPSQHSRRGLTLIELVVVIAIIGLAIPAVLTSYFAILRQQTATIRMQNLQMKGSQIMDIITQAIQSNTGEIWETSSSDPGGHKPTCNDTSSSNTTSPLIFTLKRPFDMPGGTVYGYSIQSDAPSSGDLVIQFYGNLPGFSTITAKPFGLFTKDYKIVDSSFSLSCYNANEFAPPRVLVKFTIQDANPNYTDTSLEFKTFIQLPR